MHLHQGKIFNKISIYVFAGQSETQKWNKRLEA